MLLLKLVYKLKASLKYSQWSLYEEHLSSYRSIISADVHNKHQSLISVTGIRWFHYD